MNRVSLVIGAVLMVLAQPASGQIPPRYEIVQVTENPYFERLPRINSRGQVVFAAKLGDDSSTAEIFLYEADELIQLTDDDIGDVLPDINDDGVMAWSRAIGPIDPDTGQPTLEIVIYEDGDLTRVTDNAARDWGVCINNLGHVVWKRYMGAACGTQAMDIFLYDGQEIHQITTDGLSEEVANQTPQINDYGDIVWTRYDFCVYPWESQIMLYSDGTISSISPPDAVEPQMPTMSNRRLVAWQVSLGGGSKGIQLWEDGEISLFTDWGMNVRLNDHGDMYFIRWYDDDSTYQAWLYLKGTFYQLSDDPFWNTDGDINNAGECAWGSGRSPWKDIRLLRRIRPAVLDVNVRVSPFEVRPVRP